MAGFQLDPKKGLAQNLDALLESLPVEDAELVKVFRESLPDLLNSSGATDRRDLVSRFNRKVAEALEPMESDASGEDEE